MNITTTAMVAPVSLPRDASAPVTPTAISGFQQHDIKDVAGGHFGNVDLIFLGHLLYYYSLSYF